VLFRSPQNYGILKKSDIDVSGNNPLCGDKIRMMLKIKSEKVEKISFISSGCAISKASASLFTEMIKGVKIKDVVKMKPETFLKTLDIALSPARLKCALLALSTIKKIKEKI